MVDQAVQMSPSDLVWVTWPHSKEVKCVHSHICCEGGLGSRVGGGSNRESSVPPGAALGSWDGEKVGVSVVKVGSGGLVMEFLVCAQEDFALNTGRGYFTRSREPSCKIQKEPP